MSSTSPARNERDRPIASRGYPCQNARVSVTAPDPLNAPMPELDPGALVDTLSGLWGLDGDLVEVHGERDRNFRVETGSGRYLLKVHNPVEAESVLDLQDSALRHIRAVDPGLPVPDVVPTADGRPWVELAGTDGRTSCARVMTWLDGHHPDLDRLDATRARDWGRTSARLGRALRGFVHPACSYPIAWDLRRLPELRTWLPAVDHERRPVIETVLDRFEDRVAPRLPLLRAQVVHNDLAPTNVLVDDEWRVTGITDFGDMTHTALVCDVAVTAADLVPDRPDGMDLAAEVVAGYHSSTPLEPAEAELVADLVAARYAAAVLITAGRARDQGWAPEIDDEAFGQLQAMIEADLDVLGERFAAVVRPRAGGGPGSAAPIRSTADLLAARARTLGALELSYSEPIHLAAGLGVHLEAADGRRFLDAYNNVPVLGHCHPAVVEAVSAQLATLNTNSRYLQQGSVELAERLLATFPERFDRVLLVNSGSEANDLAWRVARHVTGRAGGIATRFAYHGITEAAFAFSPEGWGAAEAPDFMRLVEAPPAAATGVGVAVASLAEAGSGVAAMLVDGVFTSDGIRGPAHAWTREAAAAVHAGGGLYVADEVQAGHGRTGDSLWSFLAGDVPADLVTLGKPMGNGYPVAAVIGPGELIDPFIEETDYFSTFGGGSAACAAALAVLRVIEEERVLDRVASVGIELRARLDELAEAFDSVSDVHGWGLSIGVDIVDPATGGPDAGRTRRIVDGARERGVLIGTTGLERSTLKIRPPLVFGPEHVPVLTDALEGTLASLAD
jgi:4-aminobutyrate aminotransferase-like enzyme/Ser/Thr protein kinase RdoA (MazF antagonist)